MVNKDKEYGLRLEIDHVSKTFGKGGLKPFTALEEISLDIKPGEFVSVVGPSGCGKSTLLLLAAGLLKSSTGVIRVNGSALTRPLTDVGIAFQDHLLLDFRTALDNVLLQGEIRKLPAAETRERAMAMFKKLKLEHVADKYPRQLSGGMRQRVSLARALVHQPAVIMMDEPLGALDALTRVQVRYELEQLWLANRSTVLFITHSVEEAVGLSDRIIVMSPSPGRIVDEIEVKLPRPRPLVLGEAPEFTSYANRIYEHFERMGVLAGAH